MYFVLPLWLAAGFADYLCHRATHIERTSGWKESALHLIQFSEMALPILAALVLQINAGVILLMIACLIMHQGTAYWDLRYASTSREITPFEQQVHSFLEMLPLMGLLIVIALHWDQFLSLLGMGKAEFRFALKPEPLPVVYIASMLTLTALFEIVPYLEEFARTIRYRNRLACRDES